MKLLFLITALTFFSTSQKLQNDVSLDEYKIYSKIIDSVYTNSSSKTTIINDSTNFDFVYGKKDKYKYGTDSLYLLAYIKGFNTSDSLEIFTNYIQNNKSKCKLNIEEFSTQKKVTLISQSKFRFYFKNGIKEGWKKFYKSHKNSTGFLKFCRAGFNNSGNKAIVYVEQYCGGLCGEGMYFLLEKILNKWKIIKSIKTWGS